MKKFLTIILLTAYTLTLSSCVFYEDKPAPQIEISSADLVDLKYYKYPDEEYFYADTQEEIDVFYELFSNAKPTTFSSVNDSPYVETYFVLKTQDSRTFYLYETDGYFGLFKEWYLESPYVGKYEVTDAIAKKIVNLF
jgi:hypothetical protein